MKNDICDLICENQPLPANSSLEKISSKVGVVTYLIDYSSYFHEIFSIASAGHDLHLCGFISPPDPEILGEKRAKTGWMGGWGVGGREIRLLAVLLSVFSTQMQVLSQGLWVLCAEMGVAWHILVAGEVSEP